MRQVDLEDNSEVPALEMVQNRKTKSKTKRCAAFFVAIALSCVNNAFTIVLE